MFGLIPRGNEALAPYAIRMLMAINTICFRRVVPCAAILLS
jgi:hypothetical protein